MAVNRLVAAHFPSAVLPDSAILNHTALRKARERSTRASSLKSHMGVRDILGSGLPLGNVARRFGQVGYYRTDVAAVF